VSRWHPILAADEVEVGVWHLVAQTGVYAIVRVLEVGGERGYRATTHAQPRQLVGYYRTLRAACEAAHRDFVGRHSPQPDPMSIYPDLSHTRRTSN